MCKLMEYWLEKLIYFPLFLVIILLDILTIFILISSLSPSIIALQDQLRDNEIRVCIVNQLINIT